MEINEGFWITDDYEKAGWVLKREVERAKNDGWVVTQQSIGPVSGLWLEVFPAHKLMVRLRCDRPIIPGTD